MLTALSWPTALVLVAVLCLVGLCVFFDRHQAGVVVASFGAIATAALPALVKLREGQGP